VIVHLGSTVAVAFTVIVLGRVDFAVAVVVLVVVPVEDSHVASGSLLSRRVERRALRRALCLVALVGVVSRLPAVQAQALLSSSELLIGCELAVLAVGAIKVHGLRPSIEWSGALGLVVVVVGSSVSVGWSSRWCLSTLLLPSF